MDSECATTSWISFAIRTRSWATASSACCTGAERAARSCAARRRTSQPATHAPLTKNPRISTWPTRTGPP
ncbi:hypothetical protein [Rhizomonospora bruguierae]|uniref:hypothetical protein n=1 Tax=Rhizomonospora bruguierae TaxID=1581705 RepID=UPI0020BEBF50|nr:hypothetical protein [Micromonospora sp. NBRC 107566]